MKLHRIILMLRFNGIVKFFNDSKLMSLKNQLNKFVEGC